MAKFVTFNGLTLIHPGGATKVDVSQMAQVSVGANGTVALIGEAEGGQPNHVSAAGDPNQGLPKVYVFYDPANAKEIFKNGPLADAIGIAFDAANDPRIPGGAQKVLAIKTNQSTGSSVTLDAQALPGTAAMSLRSRDYGAHTSGITFDIGVSASDSSNNSLDLVIEDPLGITETITGIANKALLDIKYRGPTSPVVVTNSSTTAIMSNGPAATFERMTATGVFTLGSGIREGNWVVITSMPGGGAAFGLGQIRRIRDIFSVNEVDLDVGFFDTAGAPHNLTAASGIDFSVIRGAVGPFLINGVSTTGGATNDTIVIKSEPEATPTTTEFVIGTVAGATGLDLFTDTDEGPHYVFISSGPGVGQIRKVVSTAILGTDIQLVVEGIDSVGFSPTPIANSSFVTFINMCKGTIGGGGPVEGGAFARVEGSDGAADTLHLLLRPGPGEPNGLGGTIAYGGGDVVPVVERTYELLTDMSDATTSISVGELVNNINSDSNGEAITNLITPHGTAAFNARVGTGRFSTALASRLDWVNTHTAPAWVGTNQNVDLCAGFDLPFTDTYGVDASNGSVTPVLRHRLIDGLSQVIDAVNDQSTLISAEKDDSAANEGLGVPELNGLPTPLTSGSDGATTAIDILNAYDELIKHRHNTVVPLFSSDSATGLALASVHQATLSHTQLGAGAGKNECDAILAIDVSSSSAPNSNPTAQATLLNAQADLNNQNCALVYQRVERLNINGEVTMFAPHMLAVIGAGMQAGSAIGEPLTYKYISTTDIDFPVQLDPADKTVSNTLLLSGIFFVEDIQGKGFRWVRNLSTYTKDDNLAFTDRNVREVLNHIAYDLRTGLEDRFTGLKATPATALSIKSFVVEKMSAYKNEDIIVDSNDPITGARINAWRNVKVTISGDIATIRVELFPVVGINFELISIFAQLPTISA